MNRWRRGFWVLAVLYGVLSPAWAICEAEIEKFNSVRPSSNYASQYKLFLEKGISSVDIKFRIADAERDIDGYGQETDFNSKVVAGEARIRLCYLKALLAGKSLNDRGSGVAGESAKREDQSQPNQAAQQQAEQDSRVTGPKEDCTLLLQQRPVVPAEHIACLRRNLSRERNAASAGGGQSNDGAQQQSAQAQRQAQQNQARADQARQGKRRQHEPENEAHDCLSLDKSGLFGGFTNKCNYKVSYSFCNYNPKKDSWADAHNCVGRSGNSDFVGPGRTSAAHIKNTEMVYWFACKDPAWSLDTEYVPGQGLRGRCYTVGGK